MESTIRCTVLDSHASIGASMDDFEEHDFSPTLRETHMQHSSDSSPAMSSSRRSLSPPAWRKAGSGWFKHQPILAPNATSSKDPIPEYHSADEDGMEEDGDAAGTSPSKIPLPESPVNGRSPSPTPEPYADVYSTPMTARKINPFRTTPPALSPEVDEEEDITTPTQMNYIRFTTSLDVIQRTEPIEAAITWLRKFVSHVTESRTSMLRYAFIGLLISWIYSAMTSPPKSGIIPDMVKIAGVAESFVPSIYYSEQGTSQIEELHDTGLAVWDLGESIRSSNMTGAPIIVRQLDELSESVKHLALELTSFFASLDADVDSIIGVMEWVQRELQSIASAPTSTISAIWSNSYTMLSDVGLVSKDSFVRDLLGQTLAQRTTSTLERSFHEVLSVLEESINNELSWSLRLFSMLEGIDGQFLNLRRSTAREEDQQERLESDFLSSLWTRAIGPNAHRLRKFQKNKDLLASVRDRTLNNKSTLNEHRARLLRLKSNLDALRRRLVAPQLQAKNSTQTIVQQVDGLDNVYRVLKSARDTQRQNVMKRTFGRRNPASQSIEAG